MTCRKKTEKLSAINLKVEMNNSIHQHQSRDRHLEEVRETKVN